MSDRYLIVNADDFGMCNAANRAVIDLFERGGIVSSTVMMPCAWSVAACKWAARNPQYAVGIHLTLTAEWGGYRWGPVSAGVGSSLTDELGCFYPENDEFEENCEIEDVDREIRAQVDKALRLGLVPSHLDNHMGCLYGMNGNYEVMPKTLEICGELGYAFRMFRKVRDVDIPPELPEGVPLDMLRMIVNGYASLAEELKVPLIDHLLFPVWDDDIRSSYERYREFMLDRLSGIDDGIYETFIHPSLECDELKGITSLWRDRVWEYRLFADPATGQHFRSRGINLISYRDVVRMYNEG